MVWVQLAALLVAACAATGAHASSRSRQEAQGAAQVATVAEDCLQGFAAPIFDPLRGKLAPRAQDVGSAMLALKSPPSAEERAALTTWVQVLMTCRDNVLATARQVEPPEATAILDAAWQNQIAKLLELRRGAISYGDYDAWLKGAAAETEAELRGVEAEAHRGPAAPLR